MGPVKELSLLIVVKAAPVPRKLQESICVAAIDLAPEPRWIRLFPIPFRDLADDSKFRKYQKVTLKVVRPKDDRRPESWVPVEGTIKPGRRLRTGHGWSARRQYVAGLGERNMCDLIRRNQSGSGPGTPSLAVVRPAQAPELEITEREPKQLERWQRKADEIASRPSLFDDPNQVKRPYEIVPHRFRYKYRCLASACNGHNQTIVDWEAVALWRKVRHQKNWRQQMERKFCDELWAPDRDTVLFVGNMQQRPHSFLVLGVFWPPLSPLQPSLLD